MTKPLSASERALRIELLRARAALERQSFVYSARSVCESLTPMGVARSVFPGMTKKGPANWLMQGFSVARRYPFLASGLSALVSGAGRRRGLWRVAAGLLLSWQVARALGSSSADKDTRR